MSKPFAAFFGHKSINQSEQPTPQEYTVLGINQPLIAPETEPASTPTMQPMAFPSLSDSQRKFRLSILLNKLL